VAESSCPVLWPTAPEMLQHICVLQCSARSLKLKTQKSLTRRNNNYNNQHGGHWHKHKHTHTHTHTHRHKDTHSHRYTAVACSSFRFLNFIHTFIFILLPFCLLFLCCGLFCSTPLRSFVLIAKNTPVWHLFSIH